MLMFQPLRKYADFKGRAGRAEYWQFILFQFLVGFVLSFAANMSGKASPLHILSLLFTLGMFIPTLAVAVRRFHDIGRTGWWILFSSAVLLVSAVVFFAVKGSAISQSFDDMAVSDPMSMAQGALKGVGEFMAWVFLPTWLASLVTFIFHVTEGTSGPNRFGPDPKDGSAVDIRVFDDDRIDAAIAEARSERRERDPDYKPIFDFTSPQPTAATASAPPPPTPARPTQQTPTFGKRR